MSLRRFACSALLAAGAAALFGCSETQNSPPQGNPPPPTTNPMTFFVTSDKSMTGNLGGLAGADNRCQTLAAAAGAGAKTWHAYLSVEHDAKNGGNATNAKDRIGTGPWMNAKGMMVAPNVAALHTPDATGKSVSGDHNIFIDEHGNPINGQWTGSPAPVEHDILTGSNIDGTLLPGMTCADWTSQDTTVAAQVGHSDGLGPMQNPNPPFNSWNSAHANMDCSNTAPRGGAGRLYCFAL